MTVTCHVVRDDAPSPSALEFDAVPRIGDKITLPATGDILTVFDVVHRPAEGLEGADGPRVELHASIKPAGTA